MNRAYILGAGMTGLAAGIASGLPVFEAENVPGGICSSYYVRPGHDKRLYHAPEDGEAYRFELGGGHWIFGGDPLIHRFIRSFVSLKAYERRSSVFLPDKGLFIPYPIQNHLHFLGPKVAAKALEEMVEASRNYRPVTTMAEWLEESFGPTLCELFFFPFHELYTAGLYKKIAPQDPYKSPVDLKLALQGAFTEVPQVGYNVTFVYPEEGLNVLARRMASRCDVRYGKRVVRIDLEARTVYLEDDSSVSYDFLLSTLPLNRMIELTGIDAADGPDPATSVVVINIGARKGKNCPEDHWVYIPKSRAGFHRVGFYSNVDNSFLPASTQRSNDSVSIYVEKAYLYGHRPGKDELANLCEAVVGELQDWGWIGNVEVVDPTWIEVAYTWSWPGSRWREETLRVLREHAIYQTGRFGRWKFQGIAESLEEGLMAGSALKELS